MKGSFPTFGSAMDRFGVKLLLVGLVFFVALHGRAESQQSAQRATLTAHPYQVAEARLMHAVSYLAPNEHARSTLGTGRWDSVSAPSWVSGFFAGCQWLVYEQTRNERWQARATLQTLDLSGQQHNTGDHDIGFRIMGSYGNAYRLTGDPAFKAVILTAAQSLATRYNSTVGCTRSWDFGSWQFPVIIDNLMNLELLFWAAQNGGDPNLFTLARNHALRSLQEHVRPDGSTYHVVDFDPASGNVLWKGTYQGHADNSTWARGQAWAIYGFAMAYRYSQDPLLLDGAARVADYFLANLPADGVPYWDFQAPGIPNEPKDSSAAAIAAAGLLELSQYAPTQADRSRYRREAARILRSLSSPTYLSTGSISDGILLHGVGNMPANREVDVSLIYGDYYFLEALGRQ